MTVLNRPSNTSDGNKLSLKTPDSLDENSESFRLSGIADFPPPPPLSSEQLVFNFDQVGFTDGQGGTVSPGKPSGFCAPKPEGQESPINLYKRALEYLEKWPGKRLGYRDVGELGADQMNCSEFLISILKHAGIDTSDKSFAQALALDYDFKNLAAAVKEGDRRTKGAVHAITSRCLGREVSLSTVMKNPNGNYQGMIVQYWNNAGTQGHTGVVKSIEKLKNGDVQLTLLGSNKATDGTGEVRVNLSRQKYVYFAQVYR